MCVLYESLSHHRFMRRASPHTRVRCPPLPPHPPSPSPLKRRRTWSATTLVVSPPPPPTPTPPSASATPHRPSPWHPHSPSRTARRARLRGRTCTAPPVEDGWPVRELRRIARQNCARIARLLHSVEHGSDRVDARRPPVARRLRVFRRLQVGRHLGRQVGAFEDRADTGGGDRTQVLQRGRRWW